MTTEELKKRLMRIRCTVCGHKGIGLLPCDPDDLLFEHWELCYAEENEGKFPESAWKRHIDETVDACEHILRGDYVIEDPRVDPYEEEIQP